MGAFKFQSNSLSLDIEGHVFEIAPGTKEFAKSMVKLSQGCSAFYDKFSNAPSDETVEEAYSFCEKSLDGLLGKGACKKIFADRTVSVYDFRELLEYINAEVAQHRKSKKTEKPPGREQRRKKK